MKNSYINERKIENLHSFNALKLHNLRIEYALKALQGCRNFLEIGCGEGFCTRSIVHWSKQVFEEVSGFDIDAEKVRSASASWTAENRIRYQVANAEIKHPYEDETFDAVIILDLLEHVGKPDFVIREAKRVLKSKGVLFLVVPCEGEKGTLHEALRRRGWNASHQHGGHIQAFTRRDVIHFLSENGFQMGWIRYSCHFFGQFTDYIGFRIKEYHALNQNGGLSGWRKWKFWMMRKGMRTCLQKLSYWESKLFSKVSLGAMDLNICCYKQQ
ncbi:MAG: class I SAM-dependent methyltransferase [Candidatus Omnitrophota bacterium]